MEQPFRCGYAAIVGRPNVGKSTLLNRLLGQKVSITSPKPQTTRYRILGIKTLPTGQIIYVDTPGLHRGGKYAMNRYMNRVAAGALTDVDVVIFMVEGLAWKDEDEYVLERLLTGNHPVILALNKVDRIRDKRELLPYLDALSKKADFKHILPISAVRGDNLIALETRVLELLPQGPPLFPEDQVTDRTERFLAAELIREKLMRNLEEELPYATTVEIERFAEEDQLLHIGAIVWVERPGQKAIVIGKQGAMLKTVGSQAREEMEQLLGKKVFLELWVRVREGWSDDERALKSLGYDERL
jgi:GTP-binding protein Era